MRFRGRLSREGKFWLAEVPVFSAMTQGRSRKEALAMVADWFQTMAGRPRLRLEIQPIDATTFEVGSPDTATMVRLLLRRRRQLSGLSLAGAARRLGSKSRNAYARYEQGSSVPTIEKLDQLLRAVSKSRELLLDESTAA
jgi:predicted RNase H-like HicB family nuclease